MISSKYDFNGPLKSFLKIKSLVSLVLTSASYPFLFFLSSLHFFLASLFPNMSDLSRGKLLIRLGRSIVEYCGSKPKNADTKNASCPIAKIKKVRHGGRQWWGDYNTNRENQSRWNLSLFLVLLVQYEFTFGAWCAKGLSSVIRYLVCGASLWWSMG